MERKDYQDPLKLQCLSLPELCQVQIDGVRKGLSDTIPEDVIKGIRRVIITGCGDSYLASICAVPAFKKFVNAFGNRFSAERCIDVARSLEFDPRYSDVTLVVAVSASGSPNRVAEALRRAKSKGCHTLALTNVPDSQAAREAEYKLIVNTPPVDYATPGLRNYYASLMGLYALAAYMGEAKGLSPKGSLDSLFEAVKKQTGDYAREMDRIDQQMYELALKWKDLKKFESIGDDVNWASAYFIGAKFVEVAGMMVPTMDSEDWCHVNYFAHDSNAIGTIVVAQKSAPDRSRVCETVHQARNVARPVLVTADCPIDEFGIKDEGVEYCEVPAAPEGFEFIGPMMNYVPGSLLASYFAAMNGETYFRDENSPQKKSPVGSTIKTSVIEVVD
ncbi:MAG: SIS domain-containing protein [Oscillospiraceae bacterium]|jgi:glucosamine--fructose-6-phosphate aminotransferase (isomerizing)